MRAQRDEPVGLNPPAALQHLRDRGLQVVVAHQARNPVEELERGDVPLQERLLGLARVRRTKHAPEKHARIRNRYTSSATPAITTSPRPSRPPPPRPARAQRHEHLVDRLAQRAPPLADIPADLPLGHLARHARPATARGSAGRYAAACAAPPGRPQATNRSARATRPASAPAAPPDASAPAAPPTPTPAGPSGDARRAGARAHGVDKPSRLAVSADLLEQLHSRTHPFCDLPSDALTKLERSSHDRTEVGPNQASALGPNQTSAASSGSEPSPRSRFTA